MPEEAEIVVIGGGPGGSVCAARLAMLGRRVLLLEREKHPRFRLGESLLPRSLAVLEAIGVLGDVEARFLVKRGARFVDGEHAEKCVRYAFAEAFHAPGDTPRNPWDHAFEVPRDEFDELLFRRAASCGADAREGWQALAVETRAGGDFSVQAIGPGGDRREIVSRFVVDGTGREALVARAAGDVERIPHLDRTALYVHARGAWRDEGEREGDIQIVVFGGPGERGWFWLIPFADGRTSVGAVVSNAWVQARRGLGGAEALFDAAVRETPTVSRMLEGAERVAAPRAVADFSFRVEHLCGDGWLLLGDAGGFIDPLFSSGAHLAMHGGLLAADAIDAALRSGDVSRGAFQGWEREMRAGASLFLGAVQAFYGADLVSYLFADPQHPFLRRAITSLLSGDVFDESVRWAKEIRARFPATA